MKSKCTRLVLGWLFVSLLALPALAADRAISPEEEAYASIKERLAEKVERGEMNPAALDRFLEALEENFQDLAEIREKDDAAPTVVIRHLLVETGVKVSEPEADSLVMDVDRWATLRQVRESREALTPQRRERR